MVVTDNKPQLIFDKDNANERQKSLLMFARVPLISTKVYKNIVILRLYGISF